MLIRLTRLMDDRSTSPTLVNTRNVLHARAIDRGTLIVFAGHTDTGAAPAIVVRESLDDILHAEHQRTNYLAMDA